MSEELTAYQRAADLWDRYGGVKSKSRGTTMTQQAKTTTERRDEQNEIRRGLEAKGYRWLPAREKIVPIEEWPRLPQADLWAEAERALGLPTTAIQFTGDMVGIDIDIPDPEVADAVFNAIADTFGDDWYEAVLVRGRSDASGKVMLLFRGDAPQIQGRSSGWLHSSAVGKDGNHSPVCVETFGSNSSKYFCAFGPHTLSKGIDYLWQGPSPLDVAYDDLPVVSGHDIIEVVEAAMAAVMPEHGYKEVAHFKRGRMDRAPAEAYDLPDEVYGEDGLVAVADLYDGAKVRMLEICGEGTNVGRGIFHVDYLGRPYVHDWETWTKHYREADRRPTLDERTADLGAKLLQHPKIAEAIEREAARAAADQRIIDDTPNWLPGRRTDEGRALLQRLCDNYVLWPNGKPGERIVARHNRGLTYAKDGFRDLFPDKVMVEGAVKENGEPGRPRSIYVVDHWIQSRELPTRIQGLRYLPGVADEIAEEDGVLWLNTYRPPVVGTPRDDLEALWDEFLDHLFDVDEERDWFENWLACKIQNLRSRGALVVLVSPNVEGTGRGTLFTILSALFGHSNSQRIGSEKIMRQGSASQYDDWLIDHVFAYASEFATTASGYGGKAKTALTDALKATFEVDPERVTVNPKYGSTRTDMCYLSTCIGTNNSDALVLDALTTNRRFAILSTGGAGALEGNKALAARLDAVRMGDWVDPDMAATLLRRYDVERWGEGDIKAFREAPMTEAKERMVEASAPETYPALETVLAMFEREGRRFLTVGELEDRVADHMSGSGRSYSAQFVRNDVGRAFDGRAGFAGWHRVPGRLKVAGGSKVSVVALGSQGVAEWQAMSLQERSEALQNCKAGDPRRRAA